MSTLNMKTFAHIHLETVWEIILPRFNESGEVIPITELYTSEFLETCVDISDVTPQPQQGWSAINENSGEWSFAPKEVPTEGLQ